MLLHDFKKSLKKNNFLYSTYIKFNDSSYLLNLIDYLKQKDVKPLKTVWNEITFIHRYWKCDPLLYFKYRLFEKNLSAEELLDYIPPYFFYNVYIPLIYPKQEIIDIGISKIRQSDFFLSRDIPAPHKIATIINGTPFNKKNEKIGYRDLINILNECECRFLFMKPDLGKGGKGIFMFEKKHNRFYVKNMVLDENLLKSLAKRKSYLIQEGITQRDDFMQIYSKSVNTVRLITQNFNNEVKVTAAILRMGRRGSFVDNVSSGGLDMMIDIQSGTLYPSASDNFHFGCYKKHPESGFVFEGFRISSWDTIIQKLVSLAEKVPEFPDLAWDIAVTDNGIKILEFNIFYGFDGVQSIIGGLRRKWGVSPDLQHQNFN